MFAQNIDCEHSLEPPRRGGSNGYPQSMFLSRNKKNNVYPCKPQFYYIKVGFKGFKIIQACFRGENKRLIWNQRCMKKELYQRNHYGGKRVSQAEIRLQAHVNRINNKKLEWVSTS